MKKTITFLTGFAVLASAANITAFAETAAAADIDAAAYAHLMESSWIYDDNGDNIITWEELEACDRIDLDLDGVTDISWFSRLKSCESVFLSYGEITDFSVLADMPALKLLSFTSVPLTDISFIKELSLETCNLIHMEQITLEQRLAVMRNEDYTIEAGFDKIVGVYPKGIVNDYECQMILDDTSVAEFSESYLDINGMFHGVYGIRPGSTVYRVYIDGAERFSGTITVTETQVYSPALHDTSAVSSEAMSSENYASKVMLQNGTLYGFEGDTVLVCETDVMDFQYKTVRRGYDESLDVDMLIKEDGTLYLNQTAVEGIKFRALENGCLISEDNGLYIVYPLNGVPVLYKMADDFKSFPYVTEHLYLNLSGELIWFGVAFDDAGNVIPTVEKTGVVNPVYIEEDYFIDENNTLWLVRGISSPYVKQIAENVAEAGSYIKEDGTVVDGYMTKDGKVCAVDDGAELAGAERYIAEKSYLDYQYFKYSLYDDASDNIKCYITADSTLTIQRWEQHFAVSDVDKLLCFIYDSETACGYLYFVRTDGSIWQYCIESQEAKKMTSPTAAKLRGDVNADGEFSVADVVMLQKYLACRGTVTDWSAGDLSGDNRLDVLDLCAMKRLLIEKYQSVRMVSADTTVFVMI